MSAAPSAGPRSRETLDAVLFRRVALSSTQVTALVTSVASALDELHASGAVHGDVRPRTIALDEERGGVLLPAIATGQPATAPGDIHALGLVACEVLAGRPARASEVPRASPAVRDVLARATARNEAERYATAGAFARELRRAFRASDPTEVMARPTATTVRRVPWAGPARWLLPVIAVVLLLGVLNVMSASGGTRSTASTAPAAKPASAPAAKPASATTAARTTPNVVGMPWRDAAKLLRERGFRDDVEVTADGSAAGPRGSVSRQEPAAGAVFRQGDRAKLFVAGALGY